MRVNSPGDLMPRQPVPSFVGGFDALQYRQINASGTWNGVIEPGPPPWMRKVPGVRPFATVPGATSVRGLFSQDGRTFVVAGTTFAELLIDGSLTHQVTVVEDNNPSTMICNGMQGAGGTVGTPQANNDIRAGYQDTPNTVASVGLTSHGYTTGQRIIIAGAQPIAFNGTYTINVAGPNLFQYSFVGLPDETDATVPGTSAPITTTTGGSQLLALSGGTGIVFDLALNTQAPINAPGLEPPYSMCLYIDGYGVVVKANSPQFNFSAINDLSTFSALDFAARSEGPDNISFMVRNHRELPLVGTRTSEVWQDDGVTPFSPIQGVFIEQGSVAPYAGVQVDNTVFWVGQNKDGAIQVFRLNGYTPERVSTASVEYFLRQSTQIEHAIGWAMQLEGHTFYVLYVADLPYTWVYDVAVQKWTVWARWRTVDGTWIPWFGRCHCYAFGKHLIGDRSSGTIYETSFDLLDNQVAS